MAKYDPQISSAVRSGTAAWNSLRQARLVRDTAQLAALVRHTPKSQTQSKPRRAKPSKVASSTVASVTGLPASRDRRSSHTLVLISNSEG